MAFKWLYDLLQSFLRFFVSKPTNMSNLAVRFKSRVVQGALEILSRDKTRAQKLLAGMHAHGPSAFRCRPKFIQEGSSINVIDSGR
jgi:hypothetical protein